MIDSCKSLGTATAFQVAIYLDLKALLNVLFRKNIITFHEWKEERDKLEVEVKQLIEEIGEKLNEEV